jgi:hypothetical protein
MRINHEKINKIESLFLKADSVSQSVLFWEKKCNEICDKIDVIEAKETLSNKEERELNDLLNELKTVIKRMSIENRCVDEIEKNIASFSEN